MLELKQLIRDVSNEYTMKPGLIKNLINRIVRMLGVKSGAEKYKEDETNWD